MASKQIICPLFTAWTLFFKPQIVCTICMYAQGFPVAVAKNALEAIPERGLKAFR